MDKGVFFCGFTLIMIRIQYSNCFFKVWATYRVWANYSVTFNIFLFSDGRCAHSILSSLQAPRWRRNIARKSEKWHPQKWCSLNANWNKAHGFSPCPVVCFSSVWLAPCFLFTSKGMYILRMFLGSDGSAGLEEPLPFLWFMLRLINTTDI